MIAQKVRETTLRMLFQWDMSKDAPERVQRVYWDFRLQCECGHERHNHSSSGKCARCECTEFRELVESGASVRESADALFSVVVERVGEIDGLLQKHTKNWRLERLSAVDRNIMRMAVGEFLTRASLSPEIVITEAMEVARRYSSDDSANFINGVLDAIRRELQQKLNE